MVFSVIVRKKERRFDLTGCRVLSQIRELGIASVTEVSSAGVYYLNSSEMSLQDAERIASQLLSDNVTESAEVAVYDAQAEPEVVPGQHSIVVVLNHGVTDSTATQVVTAIRQLGLNCGSAKLARRYTLSGRPSEVEISQIGRKILYNPVIEHVVERGENLFVVADKVAPTMERIPIESMTDDELMALSKDRLWLNLEEMRTIRNYYRGKGRAATDVEIETLAQTWSEHCSHKVFRAEIQLDGERHEPFIKRLKDLTSGLARDWCLSVFVDDSGVIEFDEDWGVCFKVETHNKPSGIEPFGGAHTGAGGVIRDIMATGLGAKPIANTNILCFASPDTPWERVPVGSLHPRRVMRQVVAGIEDYGNKMGIPTVNGSVCFSDSFMGNPLVYAGCVGIVERSIVEKRLPQPGDRVVLMGGLTGRDGIHGATFSSGQLTHESETISAQSVQIGHPWVQKKVLDALADTRNERLFHAIADCGGGGLSSAVGEMGNPGGVTVDLSRIPLKYPLPFISDYWISESQERMIIAVPPENLERVRAICRRHDVDVADIGEFTGDGRMVLRYGEEVVADLEMEFLHHGCPQRKFRLTTAPASPSTEKLNRGTSGEELRESILLTLAHLDECSKEGVARVYDHEVQARTVVKPFMGLKQRSPADGAVLRPLYHSRRGVIVANGVNVRYGRVNPRRMARSVVDESVRQIVTMGGSPDKIAILDNFSLPSPELDQTVIDLHNAVEGLCEAASVYQTPIISGKDSFYNQFKADDGTLICVPPVLVVSSISVIDDIDKVVVTALMDAHDRIYILGTTREELEMSCYFQQTGQHGTEIPNPELAVNLELYRKYHEAVNRKLVMAAHDCSDGGLAAAAAELVIGSELGLELDISRVPFRGRARADFVLFSESNGRLLVEVAEGDAEAFEALFEGLPCAHIGEVTPSNSLVITSGKRRLVEISGRELHEHWAAPLASVI